MMALTPLCLESYATGKLQLSTKSIAAKSLLVTTDVQDTDAADQKLSQLLAQLEVSPKLRCTTDMSCKLSCVL